MVAAPYGAEPPGVRALVLDTAAEGLRPGNRAPRINDDQIAEWIREAGSTVALRLARLDLLPPDRNDTGWRPGIPTQSDLELQARHLVHLYVASLLADTVHPERASNGKGYGAVIMARYEAAATQLTAEIDSAIERYGDDGGAQAAFPAAAMFGTDRTSGYSSLGQTFTQYGYPAGRGF